MQFRGLLTEEDAVSPVVGVILMVAVVVLLAAVVATFLTGFGEPEEVAPKVSFDYQYDYDQNLTITVAGGESFNSDRVSVDGFNSNQVTFQGTGLGSYTDTTWTEADDNLSSSTRIVSGDRVTLDDIQTPEFEVDIVWTDENGDDSSIIGSATGPSV